MEAVNDMNPDRGWIVGRRIRRRRGTLKLSQEDLASLLTKQGFRTDHTRVSDMERAGKRIDPDYLVALAKALECSYTYLLGETINPKKWTPDTTEPIGRKVYPYRHLRVLEPLPV